MYGIKETATYAVWIITDLRKKLSRQSGITSGKEVIRLIENTPGPELKRYSFIEMQGGKSGA